MDDNDLQSRPRPALSVELSALRLKSIASSYFDKLFSQESEPRKRMDVVSSLYQKCIFCSAGDVLLR